MKRALVKSVGTYRLTDEELSTVLVGVEESLNARPLTYWSAHPEDLSPLTPNHFLIGRSEIAPGTDSLPLGARWKLIQEVGRQTWSRFLNEFIPQLNQLPNWTETTSSD